MFSFVTSGLIILLRFNSTQKIGFFFGKTKATYRKCNTDPPEHRGGGGGRGGISPPAESSLLMCPFLLMSPLIMLFLKKVAKNVYENQQAKSSESQNKT